MTRSKLRAKLRRILYPAFGRNIGVYRLAGLRLLLRTQSRIDRRLIESGSLEPTQVARLIALAEAARYGNIAPAIFLDIGAYFGFYTLQMHRLGLFDRLIAFEPDAMNFAQLGATLYLNDAAYSVEARQVAVSDRNGEAKMPKSVIRKNRGTTGLDIVAEGSDMQTVNIIAIDDEFAFRDSLIVAKVDVEGHQVQVLEGMAKTIARNRLILQIEAHEKEQPATLAALTAAGLRIVDEIYPDLFATNIEGVQPVLPRP